MTLPTLGVARQKNSFSYSNSSAAIVLSWSWAKNHLSVNPPSLSFQSWSLHKSATFYTHYASRLYPTNIYAQNLAIVFWGRTWSVVTKGRGGRGESGLLSGSPLCHQDWVLGGQDQCHCWPKPLLQQHLFIGKCRSFDPTPLFSPQSF